jgi:signal transduction histidine kinase
VSAVLTIDDIRHVELFAGFDDRQLAWLGDTGRMVELADREVLFEEGERATHFYVVLTGELIITKTIDGRSEIYGRRSGAVPAGPVLGVPADRSMAAHQFTGELPLLVGGDYVAGAVANGPTRLLALDRDAFFELLAKCPQVWRVLLPALAWRIRTFESQAGRRSMLEGLGTLAAGLAHELNNPSAVLLGAANQLRAAVRELATWSTTWGELAVPDEARELAATVTALLAGDGIQKPADALAAAEAVDEVDDWLATRCGEDRSNGELAAILADQGVGVPVLEALADSVRGSVLPAAVGCLSQSMHVEALVTDIEEAAARIAALVRSTKAYSNLDRADKQQVDLVKGIEATLTMLAPKLSNVRIRRDYADLPPVPGYPSELNQVWTNLIDNAVDAMNGKGELRLAVHQEAGCAVVEVGDNGSGVPPDVLPKLFLPFFTTKDIGRGTGLGLHLTRDVITQRHHGSIDVTSKPGDTTFAVRLPIHAVLDHG